MEQKFIDYFRQLDILDEGLNTDFSDLAFAYDYNEVQELYFDETKNNFVFLAGESGLRKKDMLARICKDLLMRGVGKEDILYLNYELPILHNENILPIISDFYNARKNSENVYLVINEIQECGDWFGLTIELKNNYPKIKLLCSSSTPSHIFEKIYDEGCEWCKIVVLSKKNASNIKHESQTFGVFEEFKYNQKGDVIEIKGLTKEGKGMTHHTVPAMINGKTVRIIASGAFHDRSEMLSIDLPDTIEMIGDYAFSKCCNLTEISLPKALTYIGDHSFLGAKKLERIIGGESVAHVGNSAFYKTKWLENQKEFAIIGTTLYRYKGDIKDVFFPKEITHIASYAFADTEIEQVKVMQTVSLGEGVFYRCNNLNKVAIGIDNIPPFCFYGCSKLESEFTVECIGKFGLYNCYSLKKVRANCLGVCALSYGKELKQVIGLQKLDDGALFSCNSLEELDLKNVDVIGRFALAKTGLECIKYAGQCIGDFAFYQSPNLHYVNIHYETQIGKAILLGCESIYAMTISGKYKLTSYFGGKMPKITKLYIHGDIADDFCRNNPYLQELQILHAERFGGWSFYNNSALKTVMFTEVKTIGCWAFAYCDGIKKITLPKTVEFIGMNAFRYCHNLSEIIIHSQKCVLFGANAFYSTSENKIFKVGKGLKGQYQEARIWHEYLSSIIENN